jgi:hypothetical protein
MKNDVKKINQGNGQVTLGCDNGVWKVSLYLNSKIRVASYFSYDEAFRKFDAIPYIIKV